MADYVALGIAVTGFTACVLIDVLLVWILVLLVRGKL